ncbi:MAG: SoxR reducing system RseC family protein [Bacteroides sp.]|nr:SoxR reducing system RseC family protein [Bacteroides sp.]
MKESALPQSPESMRLEADTRQKEKIVFHLFYMPLTLLFLIGAFTYQCVLIPTVGQIAFGLATMAITLLVLKRIGRKLLFAFKQQPDDDTTQLTKSLLSYYGIFLLIAALTVAAGLFLNASYPDFDKQALDKAAIEQIYNNNPDKGNSQLSK